MRAALHALVGLVVVAALVGAGCGKKEAAPAGGSGGKGGPGGGGAGRRAIRYPVEVVPVEARPVEYRVTAVGSVEAFEIVQVTARVPGVVEAVRFTEGKSVPADAVLVEIEPQRYRLAVEAAKAALEKSEAGRAEAQAGLDRREGASSRQPGIIPAEEIETWRTRLRTAEAEVLQAQAAVQQAELNLHDAFVRAPVGGTIQTRSVSTGEYVQPGKSLATLLRRDPLLLRFNLPESDAARLRVGLQARFKVRGTSDEYTARITHVAASADLATRMVAVTAEVEGRGEDGPRPGAFAEVTVPVGGSAAAPVVPETAIRPGERGFLAYVVANGSAHERILVLGMRTGDGRIEVQQGIAPGESLVVRGAEALSEGARVRVAAPGGTGPSGPKPGSGPGPEAAASTRTSGRP